MNFRELIEAAQKQFQTDIDYYKKYNVKSVFLRRVQELVGLDDYDFDEIVGA